ncbi:MAG: DUF3501 family protein [Candidatus Eisenbacteria bacterium]|nr:DUF3501 family protein [Candidatus Eisenbacteria bacterium]
MKPLTLEDIQDKDSYLETRDEIRRKIRAEKNKRRIIVGDHCSVHFENRDTMSYQVHEMLRAENTWNRPEAIEDELEAYNALIPGEGELSATVMFEYPTLEEREEFLPKFVGVDKHIWLQIGDTEPILAELDRGQIDEHKVSSVQYAKWNLDPERRKLLKSDGTVMRISIDHPAYQAQAVLSEESRKAIMNDPD